MSIFFESIFERLLESKNKSSLDKNERKSSFEKTLSFIFFNFSRVNFEFSSSPISIFFCHAEIAAVKTIQREVTLILSCLIIELIFELRSSCDKISLTIFSDTIKD